jgi:hypothetical protein
MKTVMFNKQGYLTGISSLSDEKEALEELLSAYYQDESSLNMDDWTVFHVEDDQAQATQLWWEKGPRAADDFPLKAFREKAAKLRRLWSGAD